MDWQTSTIQCEKFQHNPTLIYETIWSMVVELLFLFERPRFGYEATKLDHVLTESQSEVNGNSAMVR